MTYCTIQRRMLAAALIACLPLAAVAQAPSASAEQAASAAKQERADDASALATLSAINAHEVASADIALAKPIGPEVKRYATMMKQEHSTNQDQTHAIAQRAGVAPVESAPVAALKRKSEEKRSALAEVDGAAFERAYIQAMVDDHSEALARIDGSLLPNAKNAEVAKHLRLTREHVQHHLDEAKRLATTIASTTDDND
jgi:putative membrane protein